jgi:hypothetical protein
LIGLACCQPWQIYPSLPLLRARGATLEHPLHRYVNAGAVLDGLLGSSAELTVELGPMIRATVTAGGEIPLLVEV